MASKKEIMKKLNERKKVLVEILDDYNKYYVDIVNKVLEGRYAGLGMCAAQDPLDDAPLCLYGCYSTLKNVEKTKRLVDVFHKKDFIEGYEDDRWIHHGSYDGLVYSISRIYSRDVSRLLHKMKELQELVSKFDACGFTPAEVNALGHLLFFEQVSLVPKAFAGHRPSFYMILNSFFSTISHYEYSIDSDKQPHEAFRGFDFISQSDVDLDELYKD
jgi:hypothetical protein